jgi:hypothetical protein
MREFRDAKVMAQSLRQALTDQTITVTHSQSLELIAKAFGLDNWNILAAKIEAERPAVQPEAAAAGPGKTLYCSFCGKSQYDVQKLIAGPTAFICDECVDLCDGIILEGDVARRLKAALASRPDADPLEAAREAFRDFSDERLAACQKSFKDGLEHMAWGLRQTSEALERKPGEPWRPDPYAEARGWKVEPMVGRSREQILAQKAVLERRATEARRGAELIERVLAERGTSQAPNASA